VEILLCNRVDKVITVSQRDKDRLAADGVEDRKIHVIPHGVDLEQFDHAQPLDVRERFHIPAERPLLVYHGIYLYPPNLEAMQVMASEILPRLHARGIKPKVLAIGANAPAKPVHEDIIFTGPVASIAPYLLAADIAVVPLQKGGGTRMKVLDYFAARLPVVSTTKGVEGIPVENGVQAVIEDDYDRFARAVADLANDSSRAREVGARGRAFVEKLDWKTITGRYLQLIDATGLQGGFR
jgi:glycosyltransferase involved in cell wall biosynthesis